MESRITGISRTLDSALLHRGYSLALGVLFATVAQGLLNSPDMQITGNQSSAFLLNWYQDRSLPVLPTATVISVPLIVYRLLMLAWALWLAVSLFNWLQWGWGCFSSNGLWNKGKAVEVETEKGSWDAYSNSRSPVKEKTVVVEETKKGNDAEF